MKQDEAKKLLEKLLSTAGFSLDKIDVEDKGEGEYVFNLITAENAVELIGHRGEVLSSFQHLVKNAFRTQEITEEGEHVKLDVDSYRSKQEDNVVDMADKRAQQVLETQRSAVLPPMSPFFRRLVHVHIKENYPELTTSSRGAGNDRGVCIAVEGETAPAETGNSDPYAEIDF